MWPPVEDLSILVAGRAAIHLAGFVAKDGDGGAHFELLPGAGRVQLPAAWVLPAGPPGLVPLSKAWLYAGRAFQVEAARPAMDAQASVLSTARVAMGVTVGDAEVEIHARVTWSLRRGRVESVSLRVSDVGGDLRVTGRQVASFERSGDHVDVQLTESVDTTVAVELSWSQAIEPGASASVPLPQITALGALSVERVTSIARDTDVEVVPRFDRGEAVAVESIPDWADGLISGTPTAARRGETSGRIDLLRFVPADRPAIVVDVAEWFVAATEDGRAIIQGTLTVRNERASSLRLALMAGMRLIAVQVEGQPVAAVPDATGWRIPLPRSVETMRGLLSFPIEVTILSTEGAPWSDGEDAAVALPAVDAEVAVRRVTLNLPRAVRALGDAGPAGRVDAFSDGEGLAYGFAAGVDQARASALYQDALGSWMRNDFDEAQSKLDDLKAIGGDNENVNRLQSNLDLIGGELSSGDEVLARRLKDQARARSLDEEQRQQDVLRFADEQMAAGNDKAAAEAYASAAETADKLALLEQSEVQDQRQVAQEAKKKESEAQTRGARRATGHAAGSGGVSLGGLAVVGSGSGGGGAGAVGGTLNGFDREDGAEDFSRGELSGLFGPESSSALWASPTTTSAGQDAGVWPLSTSSPVAVEEGAMGQQVATGDTEFETPDAYRLGADGDSEVSAMGQELSQEVLVRAPSAGRSTRTVRNARPAASPPPPVSGAKSDRADRESTLQFDFEGDEVDGNLRAPVVSAPEPSPTPDAKPVDAWAPLEVTATSAAVVVPALGETVRFQHLLLAPGAVLPVIIRVDLPRRFR